MPSSESAEHLELKRLSLVWAQANGFPVVGTEVSLPNLRFRLDAAGYRPGSVRLLKFDENRRVNRFVTYPSLGITAIFECKAKRADLIRDCRRASVLLERIRILNEARIELESRIRIQSPSLLNGDGLWPEYETAAFERATDPEYRKTVRTLQTLQLQIHGQTKMENLLRWNAANLHYLVVEPGIISAHELPSGWGLLERVGFRLEMKCLPEFKETSETARLTFLHRIAAAGTKAANREFRIRYEQIEAERRGLTPDSPEPG